MTSRTDLNRISENIQSEMTPYQLAFIEFVSRRYSEINSIQRQAITEKLNARIESYKPIQPITRIPSFLSKELLNERPETCDFSQQKDILLKLSELTGSSLQSNSASQTVEKVKEEVKKEEVVD